MFPAVDPLTVTSMVSSNKWRVETSNVLNNLSDRLPAKSCSYSDLEYTSGIITKSQGISIFPEGRRPFQETQNLAPIHRLPWRASYLSDVRDSLIPKSTFMAWDEETSAAISS